MRLARILLRLPNWLGDLLMARRAVQALRAAQPDAELRAVAPAALTGLASWDGAFHTVDAWPEPAAGAPVRGALRAWRPDAIAVLPPSFSSAWWAARIGAPVRVGVRGEARDLLLTHARPRPARGDLHLSAEYLELLAFLGARETEPLRALPVPDAARAAAAARSAALGRERWVVLGPGARYGPAKRWAADRFAAVGRHYAARGWGVLVCGAAGEEPVCAEVAAAIGAGAVSLAGTTDLATQAGLLAGASVAVCNDSGLAHLAGAVGTATVVVFGSTSSAWTAPLGPRVRVVQDAPVCSPCFQRTCKIGTVCLERVHVAHVLEACEAAAA